MNVLPEVRRELVATATRRAAEPGREVTKRRMRRVSSLTSLSALLLVASAGVAAAVAVVALVALGHRAPAIAPARQGPSGLAALEARLAVLRRPQAAADRTFASRRAGVVGRLTRLAATVDTPTAGRVRVYVVVGRLHGLRAHGAYAVDAVAVAANGALGGSQPQTAAELSSPGSVGSGLFIPFVGLDYQRGVTVGIVPDGVTRVRWVFSGVGFGVSHPRPVTVAPLVRDNIAVAPVAAGEGPLAHATWYDAAGRVIASGAGGTGPRERLQAIAAVNASAHDPVARVLLAHYSLFTAVPPDSPARDPRLPTPGTRGLRLNYWQTRYLAGVTGPDGRGLWITPGSDGVCISDPQMSECGPLTRRILEGFLGGGTLGAGRQTVVGLVPDGNRTVTLVLAHGTKRRVPVVDGNVYEATVRGRVVAIISRDAAGRTVRRSL